MSPKQKFCGECGTSFTSDVRFCGECGAASQQKQNKTEEKQRSPKEEIKGSAATRNHQQEQQKQTYKSAPMKKGFKIVPLLFWTGAWAGGWLIGAFLINFLHLYYFFPLQIILVAITGGLIAALLLQTYEITQAKPTTIAMGILVGSWIVFVLLPGLIEETLSDTFGVYVWVRDFYFLWAPAGAFLAWITTKYIARIEDVSYSKPTRFKLAIGWALCGLIPIYLSLPFAVLTLVGVSLFIYLKRAK